MTENTLRKGVQQLFPNGYRGLADSRWSGVQGSVAEAVGIDAHSQPGTLKVHQKLSLHSGEVIDERCDNVVDVSDGSRLWFSSESGKIWREVSGVYTLVYTLTPIEAFDISHAFYEGINKVAQTPADAIRSVYFNEPGNAPFKEAGTEMWIIRGGRYIQQYTLTKPFDISTATYVGQFDTNTETGGTITGTAYLRNDGARMWVSSLTASGTVYEYGMPAFDIGSMAYETVSFNHEKGQCHVEFRPNGTKMFLVEVSTGLLHEYALSTAWNVSTATLTTTKTGLLAAANLQSATSASLTDDGKYLYISGTSSTPNLSGICEFELTTPWDASTAVFTGNRLRTRGSALTDEFNTGIANTVLNSVYVTTDRKYIYVSHQNITTEGREAPSTLYRFENVLENDNNVIVLGAEEHSVKNINDVENQSVYFATKTRLVRVPTSSLGTFPDFLGTYGKFKNDSDNHPFLIQNLQLFIGDGNNIAVVDNVGNFFPESDFTLPKNEFINTLSPFDVDILVGTKRQKDGRVLRWDTFGESWSAEDIVYEKGGVQAFIKDDNFVYAYCGFKGQLYFYNGEKLEKMSRIRGEWQGKEATVKQTGVGFWQGLPVFALSTKTGNPCKLGLYTLGSVGPNYARILDLAFPLGNTFDGVNFGAVLVDGEDIYVSVASGIYKLDQTAKYEHAHIESRQLTDGIDRSLYNTKTKYHVNYVSLPANTDVEIRYRGKYADSFVEMEVVNDTKHERIDAKLSVPNITSLQLRFDIVVSGNTAPEIENINII